MNTNIEFMPLGFIILINPACDYKWHESVDLHFHRGMQKKKKKGKEIVSHVAGSYTVDMWLSTAASVCG